MKITDTKTKYSISYPNDTGCRLQQTTKLSYICIGFYSPCMKTPSKDLFSLIQSLTTQEKVYFKTFVNRKTVHAGGRSYIKLFDVLNKMKEYDDAVLHKMLSESGIHFNIHKAKNYLIEAVLKSLADYHSDSSVDAEIRTMITQADILYKRKLKKMADKIVDKAEELALEHEKHEYLLLLCAVKSNMALELDEFDDMKEFMETGIKKEQRYMEHYNNTIAYRNLAITDTVINQSPELFSGSKAQRKSIKKLFAHPMLQDSRRALTLSSKKYFYSLNYKRFITQNKLSEKEKAYRMFKEWVQYLENKGAVLNSVPEMYIWALARLFVCLHRSAFKENEVEQIFSKAKHFYESLPKKRMNQNIQMRFANFMANYINIQLFFLTPEKSVKQIAEMNGSTYRHLYPVELNTIGYFNMAMSYFLLAQYHQALACLNNVVNIKSKIRMDSQADGRIFLLIIHYEMKNMDLLPYIAKSSERWLEKNNYALKSFDKLLMDFFKYKLPKINTNEQQTKELSALLAQLKKEKHKEYSIFQKEFDMVSWLESKIENRPMLEILREKSKIK